MRLLTVALLCCGLVVSAADARADNAADARKAFKAGRDAFKAGNYAVAAQKLAYAYKLKPHPALLRYLGQTYYKMNKARKAISYFKRYLKDAPKAPDRAKIQAKVRELEMVVGASDDDDDDGGAAAPAPKAAPTPTPAPTPAPKVATKPKVNLAPTGEDNEVPDALRPPGQRRQPQQTKPDDSDKGSGGSALGWMKWVATGLAVGGIAMGATFAGLAAGDASSLESAVRDGNPTGTKPTTKFSKEHFDLEQGIKSKRTISIVSFVSGGAMAAAAVIFWVLDKPSTERSAKSASAKFRSNVALAPMIGGGTYGVAGALRF